MEWGNRGQYPCTQQRRFATSSSIRLNKDIGIHVRNKLLPFSWPSAQRPLEHPHSTLLRCSLRLDLLSLATAAHPLYSTFHNHRHSKKILLNCPVPRTVGGDRYDQGYDASATQDNLQSTRIDSPYLQKLPRCLDQV